MLFGHKCSFLWTGEGGKEVLGFGLPLLTRTSNPKNGNSRNRGCPSGKKWWSRLLHTTIGVLRSVQRPQVHSTPWGLSWHYLPTTSRQWDCSLTPMHRTRYRMRPGGLSLRGDGLSIGPRTKAHLAGVKGPGEDQRRPKIVTNCIVSVQPLEYRTRFPS